MASTFRCFPKYATGVQVLLFAASDDPRPIQIITLDSFAQQDFSLLHVFVQGLEPGAHYAFRVSGPFDPSNGQRCNANKS